MSENRSKIQLELALVVTGKGEASIQHQQGSESLAAAREHESLAGTERLMEEICDRENMKKALKRVRSNRGSAGIDGMTVDNLPDYLEEHWPEIEEQLLTRSYRPRPVKRVEIPKAQAGKVRLLGIPCVLDRLVQQAVLQVLQPRWDPTFSEYSYGFRPGRSAHQAIAQAQTYIAEGYGIVVDIDLKKFFDRVNHDSLMGRVAKRVSDKRVLKIIRAFLNAGVMENGLAGSSRRQGVPQGGPLSPLLSNLVLDDLDRELTRRGHRFVRYADDCNVYVRSERAGHRVMKSLRDFITSKLKLQVNESKSAVARPQERSFLGFRFTGGRKLKRGVAPQALQKFKKRVRQLTRRSRGVSLEQMVQQLARYLRGWLAYFSFCETLSVLRDLDSWIRRRLRSVVWKQWKTYQKRRRGLQRQGLSERDAAQAAYYARNVWRTANSQPMKIAFPNAFFDSLGLPRLVAP
jgi:RNA-directed DNA polymerase